MTNDRTLIAYVTKGGVTEESVSVIADVLSEEYELEVDVINLKKNASPNLSQYQNVIIGSGVRMQRVYKEALKFIETNDFEGKKVALFISSVESRDEAIAKYVKRILEKYPHLRPVTFEVFGGRMKILRRTATDKRDIERVRSWVEELGRILME